MQNYRMKIAYDGRRYKGYSRSKGDGDKSIQGKLESILSKAYGEEIEVICAVNTAAGVHAKGQVINFEVPDRHMSGKEIMEYFEKYLTDDIIVLSIEEVDERFHSRYLAKEITYEYRLWKKEAVNRPLFERHYVNLLNQKVDIGKIKKAAKQLEGEHDFLAFTTNRKTRKSIRNIFSIQIEESRNEMVITITADGYLLHMERLIIGTLIQIGLGQLPINVIEKAFQSGNLSEIGHKASAEALCLLEIKY